MAPTDIRPACAPRDAAARRAVRAGLFGASLGAWLGASPLIAQTIDASGGETRSTIGLSGWLESELRLFPQAGLYAPQRHLYPAVSGELRLAGSLSQRKHRWTVTGFARGDPVDGSRSHVELREASWTWQPAEWQLRAGMLEEFWGVTESNRLVDVVNQRDQREAPDEDAKLGQPGVAWTGTAAGGTLEILALTYHRPRAFGLGRGRFRPPPTFVSAPAYESAAGRTHIDWAGRWSTRARTLDVGLSHFWGTSREPDLRYDAAPQPRYPVVHQTGLDAQLTLGSLLLKLEAIRRQDDGHAFGAVTTGGEYVLGNVAGTGGDVVLFAELTVDARRARTLTGLDRDLFLAARWNPNDEAGTELSVGGTLDLSRGANVVRLEGSRRWSGSWRLTGEALLIGHQQAPEFGYLMRRDSFVRAGLARHF
jgi:hypothetical protein